MEFNFALHNPVPNNNGTQRQRRDEDDMEVDEEFTLITFTQFLTRQGESREQSLSPDTFNRLFDFRDCLPQSGGGLNFAGDPSLLIVGLPFRRLIDTYHHFLKRDLRTMAMRHKVALRSQRNDEIILELKAHICVPRCNDMVYIFKSRSRPRDIIPIQRVSLYRTDVNPVIASGFLTAAPVDIRDDICEDQAQDIDGHETFDHLQPLDDARKIDIISEWEKATDSDGIKLVVCSVCSIRERQGETLLLDGTTVDLSLLRNDELPAFLQPRSYNFLAYDRAILNPKGLLQIEAVGQMRTCKPCAKALQAGLMPKFALANWLYYGRENLPGNIAREFSETSMFERMLISRARCNSICCKFNVSENEDRGPLSRLRKGIRGNVMVAPLDAVRMHKVLPPDINEHLDTMSAVIVGDKMPTRATISKLGPVLVRKSRVRNLLSFLIGHNPHYALGYDLAFSQRNLDAIHDSEDMPDIPKTVAVGQLPSHHVVDGIDTDYTPRNEDEFIESKRMDELVMENVGYTEGDDSPEAYKAMKLLALERCLSGKPFVASGTGNRMVADFHNPCILSWLFPHLDPWGIGGFHEPRRRMKLSMKEQLSHLLRTDDPEFESDPEFAFVFYNVLRKAEVSRTVRFRIPKREQARVVNELKSIDTYELRRLTVQLEKDPKFRPFEPQQKKIMNVLKSISIATHSLPGSNGYKLLLRNQIRAIINGKGAPTLFITLNPSDVDSPIVRIFAGEEIDLNDVTRGEDMDAWRRKVFAAKNPSACARFFDFMIRTFIEIVLGYGKDKPGLYGFCTAYYGTVEAQGKGTLHCHMLIWLHGHLPPQDLRDRLMQSEEYKQMFVCWLESIIKNEFPTIAENPDHDPARNLRVRAKDVGEPHPGVIRGPSLLRDDFPSTEDYWRNFKEHLVRLLNEYNWHEHTETCWKYLKAGEVKSDQTCRMRMDGLTQTQTEVDQTTGLFQLRRLHPWISSYTDVVTFLMKCNMNVQFIGSGDAAKAFLYYLTDYVTKPSLALHAGLAALSYALKKIGHSETTAASSPDLNTLALTKTINGMMGRQEISHQQVMSYLVGGGDHYTSEKFQNLHLWQFFRHIDGESSRSNINSDQVLQDDRGSQEADESISLTIDENDVTVNNQVFDYCFRPTSQPFETMCLYDFVAQTSKAKVPKEETLIHSPHAFSSWNHPQRNTHKLAIRTKPVLPVILGPSVPNRKGTSQAKDLWGRHILVLFKPWRSASDLKEENESWWEAYQIFENQGMSSARMQLIANMELLTDGANLRFTTLRHTVGDDFSSEANDIGVQTTTQMDIHGGDETQDDIQEWRDQVAADVFRYFEESDEQLGGGQLAEAVDAAQTLERELGKQVSDAVTSCLQLPVQMTSSRGRSQYTERYSDDNHGEEVSRYKAMMKLKRKRCIETESDENPRQRQRQRRIPPASPFVGIEALPLQDAPWGPIYEAVVMRIVGEMNLTNNAEQLEAFLTVAKHASQPNADQLLMMISGVGGTGKSHVIKAIVMLFEHLNRRETLLLGAPTGSAAILIGGYTLHSIILESPNSSARKNASLLNAIWNNIQYLIIDEVSMIGASFLSRLSNAIRQGKGDDTRNSHKAFGGVNVIFVGDMCQLKPPRQTSLYARELANAWSSAQMSSQNGISALNGVYVWRQVNKVIELIKNCRHAGDPPYSEFLSRLRVGRCLSRNGHPWARNDYDYLQPRLLSRLRKENPEEFRTFWDAPFIVGSRQLRDMLNTRLASFHANRLGEPIHVYHSKDYCRRTRVPLGATEYLWSIESKNSAEIFGRLPLFEGMKVMVTENIAFDSKVVNGTEGVVKKVIYEEDEDGKRYATLVYVYVEGLGFELPGLERDVVPIFPARVQVEHARLQSIGLDAKSFTRVQLPLIPAYAYTDFKSQGRTLSKAIVDIVTARGQGTYVMLSRVTSLSGLAILRWFPESKIYNRLPEDLRREMIRLNCQL